MECVKKISEDIYWVGVNERRQPLFENIYPVSGYSCNAYFIDDEKKVLLDTVDAALGNEFFDNLDSLLHGGSLDYVIVNHMEPDHCAMLGRLLEKYPGACVIGNTKTATMAGQFFGACVKDRFTAVNEGDSICCGRHTLKFYMAPMVHWPEAMVTYDETSGSLFSADAFGTFGPLDGNIFADEVPFDMDSARIYYTNIVGKYGVQVSALLKKASALDIGMVCPLHGPVWRENIGMFIDKYVKWSSYTPEDKAVVIACASIYGNTERACERLAFLLGERGVKDIRLYDLSRTHVSVVLAEAFRCSHIVLAASTYNNGIFTPMETLLSDLKSHGLKGRKVSLIQNGTWAPVSGKIMKEALEGMKDMEIVGPEITIKSSPDDSVKSQLEELADNIAAQLAE